jgi:hypothetical protein
VPFEIKSAEERRPLWPFLLAGAVIVLVLLVIFGAASHPTSSQSPSQKPLPFGPAEQRYAILVRFQNLHLSRFENMFKQQVTYVDGDILNAGNRTIGDLEITVEFRNVQNQVVMRQTMRPLEPQPVPILPGQQRSFRLGFEQVPDDWDMQNPTIRVTGLALQ